MERNAAVLTALASREENNGRERQRLLDAAQRDREHARDEYDKAAAALAKALECDPTDLKLRYLRAETLFQAGRPPAAAAQAREALAYDARLSRTVRRLTERERTRLLILVPELRRPLLAAQAVLSATSGIAGLVQLVQAGNDVP